MESFKKNPRCGSSKAFTLVELLVVVGIIAVLISILLPSLNRAYMSATRVSCSSNMRQIGMLMYVYSAENKGFLPPYAWANKVDAANNLTLTGSTGMQGLWDTTCVKPTGVPVGTDGSDFRVGYGLLPFTPKVKIALTAGGQWQNTFSPISRLLICPADNFLDSQRTAIVGGGWYQANQSTYRTWSGRKTYDPPIVAATDPNRRDSGVRVFDRNRIGVKNSASITLAMCPWLHGNPSKLAGPPNPNIFSYPARETAPLLFLDGHVTVADFKSYVEASGMTPPVAYTEWYTPNTISGGKLYLRLDSFGSR